MDFFFVLLCIPYFPFFSKTKMFYLKRLCSKQFQYASVNIKICLPYVVSIDFWQYNVEVDLYCAKLDQI